ncbi:hypothetical protein JQ506_16080 [Shinella sp. PSBB067]|uniref:hypothetical protein n=1 Tax=Shinella sp. PSBB067 TaxID=2715959 RepID=UPI00193B831F|nr:hypothetical protein [Shinella sp. PSBB067]QRI62377.1 hypothetical protein JQ506_16080 [Shinella sp. PSBB067]
MLREFDTSGLQVPHRIGNWRAAVAENLVEIDCRPGRNEPFTGSFSVFSTGECGLASLRGSCRGA